MADYCGECNARWLLNGQEVTSQCEDEFHSIMSIIIFIYWNKKLRVLHDIVCI